jgi:cell division protein FtsB
MLRAFIGGLVVAAIALAIGFAWYRREKAVQEHQAEQIVELNAQISKLQADNQHLQAALAKLEDEETHLARDNDALRKALEQASLTGKAPGAPPKLPYPPK